MHVKNDVKNEAKISNSSICEFNPYIAERMIQFFNIKKINQMSKKTLSCITKILWKINPNFLIFLCDVAIKRFSNHVLNISKGVESSK